MKLINRKLTLTTETNIHINGDKDMKNHDVSSLSSLLSPLRQAKKHSKNRAFAIRNFTLEPSFIKPVSALILLIMMSLSVVTNSAHAYISADADRSSCRLDNKKSRTAPGFTIRGFAAYKNHLEGNASVEVDKITKRLGRLIKKKAKIHSIEIVGHAAKYGSSNFLQTSISRAQLVEAEIKSSLIAKAPSFDEDLIPFNTYGVSIFCPIDDNRTQASRAKNRRVEVWIHYSAAPKKKKRKVPSLKKMLSYVAKNSEVKATSCMARKLLKANYDHDFVSRNTIEEVFNETLSGDTLMNFLEYKTDLKALAKTKRKKIINIAGAQSQTDQGRFSKFMESERRNLVKAITIDLTLKQCDDARTHAMRRHVRERLSKKKKSFYSCPTIKAHVDKMYKDNNSSYRGCGKGY